LTPPISPSRTDRVETPSRSSQPDLGNLPGEQPSLPSRERTSLSDESARILEGALPGRRLGVGTRGKEVAHIQAALIKWMPSWRNRLAVDGVYGQQTKKAVEFFKRTYGLGKDGTSLDAKSARYLREVRDGTFWVPNSPPRHLRAPDMEKRYQRALKSGYPFDVPANTGGNGLTPDQVRAIARSDPARLVKYKGFEGQALTFKRYIELEKSVSEKFPGYHAAITCTTEGSHSSSAHGEGRAVDFVLERDRDNYRPAASEFEAGELDALALKNGFHPYNEYLNDSTYKTGEHMHVEMQ